MKTNTIPYQQSLSPEQKYEAVKNAKLDMGCTWSDEHDKNYTPYCGSSICSTSSERGCMPRMKHMPYGFKCGFCNNMLGFDMVRLEESPLNKKI